jgi:hypothetical protein
MSDQADGCSESLVWCAVHIGRRLWFTEGNDLDRHAFPARGSSRIATGQLVVEGHALTLPRSLGFGCVSQGLRPALASRYLLPSQLPAALYPLDVAQRGQSGLKLLVEPLVNPFQGRTARIGTPDAA